MATMRKSTRNRCGDGPDDLRDQQLTLFGNYQLPFGRSKRFGVGAPTWLDYVIGGYELSTSVELGQWLAIQRRLEQVQRLYSSRPLQT